MLCVDRITTDFPAISGETVRKFVGFILLCASLLNNFIVITFVLLKVNKAGFDPG